MVGRVEDWRKTVRIEHTSDSESRRTVLKTVPDTSPACLPGLILPGAARGIRYLS